MRMEPATDLFDNPTFLDWLPGESLFSLVSRHHYFWGHRLSAQTCQQFFGHARSGSQHDLPSRLRPFVDRTGGCFGDAAKIAKEHTLLAYYAAFNSVEESENAIQCMAGGSVAHLKLRLGILTSRFRANHPLKACKACMKEDRDTLGWAYWHVNHQFPGVWICPTHGQLLRESTLKSNGVERFQWHLPCEDHLRVLPSECASVPPRALRSLSQLVIDLVAHGTVQSIDTFRLHELYRAALTQRGWVAGGGNYRMPQIASSFLEHVRPLRVLPEFEALPATLVESATQLGRLLRPPRSGTHPLRHLVLIQWLFGDAAAFTSAYVSMCQSPIQPPQAGFPTDERVGIATTDAQRNQLIDLLRRQKQSFRRAAHTMGIDVGTAMAWAAQAGIPVPRRPKKLVGGLRWQTIVDLKSGADKAVAATRAGVSVVTITKLLLSEVGLHAAWREAREKRIRAGARASWLKLLKAQRGLGVTLMRAVDPANYIWLYRNDRAWLLQHKPAQLPNVHAPGKPRLAWDLRDQSLSAAVQQAWLELSQHAEKHPIKLWQLYQAVPALKAKLSALGRLPLTRRVLDQALRHRKPQVPASDLFE
jgi:Tn7-like transposition protein D/TniQ